METDLSSRYSHKNKRTHVNFSDQSIVIVKKNSLIKWACESGISTETMRTLWDMIESDNKTDASELTRLKFNVESMRSKIDDCTTTIMERESSYHSFLKQLRIDQFSKHQERIKLLKSVEAYEPPKKKSLCQPNTDRSIRSITPEPILIQPSPGMPNGSAIILTFNKPVYNDLETLDGSNGAVYADIDNSSIINKSTELILRDKMISVSDTKKSIRDFLPVETLNALKVLNEELKNKSLKEEFTVYCSNMIKPSRDVLASINVIVKNLFHDRVLGCVPMATDILHMQVFKCLQDAWTSNTFGREQVNEALRNAKRNACRRYKRALKNK